ncbi:YitT family protein [uncultured Anaerococcus sp.]|uniref:YitT family protein n=1 Tax=uncultured Anaerococcus sp. TaxID=293428 RepID=UPI0026322642|nr:YitT family protein [uncultured Anaerococcus sp.]
MQQEPCERRKNSRYSINSYIEDRNRRIHNHDPMSVQKRVFLMSFASIFMACGTHFFKYPNSFVIGGVEGMSIIASMFVPFTRPQLTLFINVALLVIAFFVLGKKFTLRTGYVAILNSLTALALDKIMPIDGTLTGNTMLEFFFTLIMSSVGSAILFNIAASSGGTDIVAMIVKKYSHLEVGKSLLFVDSLFTIASIWVFGIEIGLFSIFGLLIKGLCVDVIISSMKQAKMFIIITSKTEEIGSFIKDDLNRSATVINARGLYQGKDLTVYLCTTNKMEAPKFRMFIKNIDPKAFITIVNTSTVMGKGWYQTDELTDD